MWADGARSRSSERFGGLDRGTQRDWAEFWAARKVHEQAKFHGDVAVLVKLSEDNGKFD